MPSSIFSSDRAPDSQPGVLIVVTLTVAICLLIACEMFWALRGAEPGFVDDMRRWSSARERVEHMTNRTDTVLLGASRIQLGWSMDAFRSHVPGAAIVQLAIDGTSPFAVLRDLSRDTDFSGVVIVSMDAGEILRQGREAAQGHVDFFHRSWTLNTKLNFFAEDLAQEHLITRQQSFGLSRTLQALLSGGIRTDSLYLETTGERERNADYSKIDIAAHRAERVRRLGELAAKFRPPTDAEWNEGVSELASIVRPMVQRGARVIFVRFPTSGEHWTLDEQMFPRNRYWDDLARRVAGVWLHFSDIKGMDQFPLPDTSHLDQRDKAAFSRLLLARLSMLGVY